MASIYRDRRLIVRNRSLGKLIMLRDLKVGSVSAGFVYSDKAETGFHGGVWTS